ncbi:MAG TPA: sigma-70 family RNA polymerase sigma factor [Polyangiaceae bacterium]|nr:sigma-70 family RNA polymerase sigma factor [Polyangiaceae bacterium]
MNAPAILAAGVEPLSFATIFARDLGYVWTSLRRLGVPNRDLEDLSHDVFFRVYQRLGEYDRERPFRPWLFGFCFRVASDYRRRFANQREILGAELEPLDPAPDALDRLLQAEATSLAQLVLQSLELDRRAVFVMHEIDGCPIPEVANTLGIPLNTAYSRLRLAREQFADGLRRERLRRGER